MLKIVPRVCLLFWETIEGEQINVWMTIFGGGDLMDSPIVLYMKQASTRTNIKLLYIASMQQMVSS